MKKETFQVLNWVVLFCNFEIIVWKMYLCINAWKIKF